MGLRSDVLLKLFSNYFEDLLQHMLNISMKTSPEMSSPFVSSYTRPHLDAAAVGLSKVSKIIQKDLCLSFVSNSFTDL